MRFKVLMVDPDGVIRRWEGPDGQIKPSYGLPKGATRQIAFSPDLLSLAVTGQITDEEWRQRIAEQLQLEFSSNRAAAAVTQWSRFTGEVDWETVFTLKRYNPSVRRAGRNANTKND